MKAYSPPPPATTMGQTERSGIGILFLVVLIDAKLLRA